MLGQQKFSYKEAFDRNRGWLTAADQEKLCKSRVAIAGVGGAGGFQIQALARLGVGQFKIADPDVFETSNTNRQVGATQDSIGKSKVETMRDMILSINPEAKIECFASGISQDNIHEFLAGVDVALDGVDFFTLKAKMLLFDEAYKAGIAAVTACPLGFGASVIAFLPKSMPYRDYLDIHEGMSEKELRVAFAFGLSPSPLCLSYIGSEAIDFSGSRAASVSPGLMLVGALAATECVKIMTNKTLACASPSIFQVDLMTQKVKKKTYLFGMKSPLQRFKKQLILSQLKKRESQGV